MGPQVERQRHDNRGAEGCEEGGVGVPAPLGGGRCPLSIFFSNFYIKIVCYRAFLLAISYRLADCFTRIGNMPGIQIYWRSFQHFGNQVYNYSLRKIARQKVTKMHQKFLKEIARRLRCFFFLYISVFILLKYLRVVDWGHGPRQPPDYAAVQTTRCINF